MDVNGRVAFITGAASGIGFAIATAFARAGAHVALADVDEQAVHRAVARLQSLSLEREVTAVVLDVRDRDAFAQAADAVEERLGPIEILCNNAGVGSTVPIAELTYDTWDLVLGINLGGVVNGVQTVLPRLLARGGPGHIVNVASGAGLVPSEITSYVASKFAVVGLTESLALQHELAAASIGVTVVCPGIVRTEVLRNSRDHVQGSSAVDDHGHALLQRYGLDPAIVGDLVLAGIHTGQLHVLTDRYIEPLLEQRAKDLAAALPEETERDRELAELLRQRTADRVQREPAR
ncbi:SDR family oxidoreductase [Ruania zhangjianzhongii]|uniref:SDR family oxidoreductase n=1 Tax=Ruania zhangjianzhongii TaxID=2603206 RepID=UPI0011CBE36E|nr:SDR family oxidoreductase [Ruania zhangjianzhongii]